MEMLNRVKYSFLALITVLAVALAAGYAAEDAHYLQGDDYFVAERALGGETWIRVMTAKMVTAPTAQTKNEGKFMQIADGKEIWTKYYWATRPASAGDIKIGTVIIALDIQGDEEIYRSPEDQQEAKTSFWFMAKITDVSDLYKGYVTVSGGYKVSPKALRVIIKK